MWSIEKVGAVSSSGMAAAIPVYPELRRACPEPGWVYPELGWFYPELRRAAHFLATTFSPRALARRSVLHEFRQIKSPNSGNRTPRNPQKTNTGDLLKSPKNQLLPRRKFEFTRQLLGGRDRSAEQEAQCISTRFWPTSRNGCNALKTKHRPISTRF